MRYYTDQELREGVLSQDLPVSKSDLEDFFSDKQITADDLVLIRETAYRRGFSQGAAACFYAAEKGATHHSLKKYLLRLMEWRTKRHNGEAEDPEWMHDNM